MSLSEATGTAAADRFQRRRANAARAVEQAALRLFTQHGFDAVSVEDIATAAAISPRTFFRYFDSKDDVLLGYQRRLDTRLADALRDRPPSEGAVTALRAAFVATSTTPAEERVELLQRFRAIAASPSVQARSRGEHAAMTALVVPLVAERMGVDPQDPRPRVIAAALGAIALSAWDSWVAGAGTDDPADIIAAHLDLVVARFADLDQPSAKGPK
ncbi:probable transcriptional regulator, TetR family (plasmid) [Rhodococcus jostii RHA1]|uniref:Probable transcriptional regulator, TetR family n=1 Tax=Rhodococcus jostii (strain RHA1) TaxID=101510 RepID=Q0RVY8_RHOJR|nr:TetR family transcriptional regulator [Rhodococcus jostii]ABH00548.1 probable transcriptional regulator, TetR family [Rhodococcus jostii RHA1]